MTDSGQAPGTPPDSLTPGVPPWAPNSPDSPAEGAPRPAPPPAPGPAIPVNPVPAAAPYVSDVSATMRLIPVPPPSTPPPPIPVMVATPPPMAGEHYHGKYRVKGELGP